MARGFFQCLWAPKARPDLLPWASPQIAWPTGWPFPRALGSPQGPLRKQLFLDQDAQVQSSVEGMPSVISDARMPAARPKWAGTRDCHPSRGRSARGTASPEETHRQSGQWLRSVKSRGHTGGRGNNQIPNCTSPPLKKHAQVYEAPSCRV